MMFPILKDPDTTAAANARFVAPEQQDDDEEGEEDADGAGGGVHQGCTFGGVAEVAD